MALRLQGFRPVSHVEAPHTCEHCRRITITEEQVRECVRSGALIRLPQTTREAKLAAHDGCVFFELYSGFLERYTPRVLVTEVSKSLKRCFASWKTIQSDLNTANGRFFFPRPLDRSWAVDESKWKISTRWKHFKYIISHLGTRHLYVVLSDQKLWINYLADVEMEYTLRLPMPRVRYDLSTSSDDPSAQFVTKRSINSTIWDERSVAITKQWLTNCDASHHDCQNPSPKRDSFVPQRLLKLDHSRGSGYVQLYETQKGESVKWCALSYCWGGDQPVKTTRKTLENMKRGIAVKELPQTLQDAFTVSTSLEIEFLWIDALCILQDSEEDIGRELQQVPWVYRYAYLTISASSAKSVLEGFLQDRGHYYTNLPPFTISYKSSNGNHGKLLMSEDAMYTDNRVDWRDPVDDRCWTLQEQGLSPRLLQFSKRQLKFRCTVSSGDGSNGVTEEEKPSGTEPQPAENLTTRTKKSVDKIEEDTEEPFNTEPTESQQTNNDIFPSTSLSSVISTTAEPATVIPEHIIRQFAQQSWSEWKSVIQQYSERTLSFPQDKLRAVSGLARWFSEVWNTQYIAGLFVEHFPLALCWSRQQYVAMRGMHDDGPLSTPTPLPYTGPAGLPGYEGAPSWSWLAAEGEIGYAGQFWDINNFQSEVELEELYIDPRPPFTTFDAINGGRIVLKGKLSSARWYMNENIMLVDQHEFSAYNDSGRKDLPQEKDAYIEVWALLLITERNPRRGPIIGESGTDLQGDVFYPASPDGYLAGLILEACPDTSFKRLGVFTEPPFKRAYFFEDVEPRVVNLI